MIAKILTILISFIVAVIISPFMIKFLRRVKFGQEIREIGPSWHSKKRGTPTMGGIIFIIAVAVALAINYKSFSPSLAIVAAGALGFGVIGFIDDFIKVVMKRNLGLTSLQKFSMQLLVTIAVILVGLHYGVVSTKIYIPFVKVYADMGWLYIPFAIFVVLGTVNSVNLTDGIDGLATSVTIVVMLFFGVIFAAKADISAFVDALIGGLFGFLLFNKNPAKVFMGDTGSLFLGGAVAGLAIISENPLILVLVGFVYFAETLSVILQVASFKLTGKRIFKMSPIHHHFEMSGWNEKKIVLVFTTVTVTLAVISYIAI